MGQCPVMLPPEPSDEHNEIQDSSDVTTSRTVLCSMGRRHGSPQKNPRLLFLRPHDPDRPFRNILHPDEVLEMLSYQAEEHHRLLTKEKQVGSQQVLPDVPPRLVRDYANYEINTVWSAASFESGSSVIAPSEVAMTTVSAATAHVSNLDRYTPSEKGRKKNKAAAAAAAKSKMKPNREFSVMESIDDDAPSVASTMSATSASSPSSSSCHSIPSPGMMDMSNVRRRFQSRIESTGRMEKGASLGQQPRSDGDPNDDTQNSNALAGPPLACQLLLSPCLGSIHHGVKASRAATRKNGPGQLDDCTVVLHLKMKAHSVDYYQYHYLPMFPNSPTPPGVTNILTPSPVSKKHKQHTKPTTSSSSPTSASSVGSGRIDKVVSPVFSSSSSISSATGGIDYFVGPTVFPVRFLLNDSIFMDLAITGSLGLVHRQPGVGHGQQVGADANANHVVGGGDASSNPASPTTASETQPMDRPHRKSPEHYIVLLHRRSGMPLAVCALKATTSGPPIVRIYATKQRNVSQRSVASTEQLGLNWSESTYPLYAWAEMVATPQESSTSSSGGVSMKSFRYDVFMAAGADGRFEPEPSYCASPAEPGSPTIHVVGRTESEDSYTGCAIFSLESRTSCGLMQENDENEKADETDDDDDEPFFQVSIARGIDPALMICLVAIIDEIMEKSMRMQCEEHTRVALRRVR